MKKDFKIVIGVVVIALIVLIFAIKKAETPSSSHRKQGQSKPVEQIEESKDHNKNTLDKFYGGKLNLIGLNINQPNEINYFTREQVFSQRRYYVSKSRFANPKYNPSKSPVWEQIEDGKPWLGLASEGYSNEEYYAKMGARVTEGVSEETRFLNNPDILVGITFGGAPNCASESDKVAFELIPKALYYSEEEKTYIVEYNLSNYFRKIYCRNMSYSKYKFNLSGVNARDLGYPFVYADNVSNIAFADADNISNTIKEFQDFVHTGGSCRVPGGCNNGSPRQEYLFFYFNTAPVHPYSYMTLKLWKNSPKSTLTKADSNLIMIFK